MKLQHLHIIVLVVLLLFGSACARPPGEISAKLGQEFTLAPGQSAAVAGEPLKVKFLEVISDSRCPTGAVCIWQGESSCLLEVTYNQSAYRKTLTQPGLTGPAQTTFADYQMQFNELIKHLYLIAFFNISLAQNVAPICINFNYCSPLFGWLLYSQRSILIGSYKIHL